MSRIATRDNEHREQNTEQQLPISLAQRASDTTAGSRDATEVVFRLVSRYKVAPTTSRRTRTVNDSPRVRRPTAQKFNKTHRLAHCISEQSDISQTLKWMLLCAMRGWLAR
jgi:hypothetical protein